MNAKKNTAGYTPVRVTLGDDCLIIASLKDWLDANTYIESGEGTAYWYYDKDGRVVIDGVTWTFTHEDGKCIVHTSVAYPWIAICDNETGEPIYTDNMSYEWHDWADGNGRGKSSALLDLLPPDVLADVKAGTYDDLDLREQVQAYLRYVNGWDFATDYFDSSSKDFGDGNLSDKDIVRLLDIPHDPDKDKSNPDKTED